ncbi:MAG: heme exporter protein CcmD [Proteobacteria bacterium]|nr:heme exporter protein CcmD [Pseudomonadota bacterium]
MALGPHAIFIVVAYAAAVLVVGALVAWVMLDHRTQRRRLAELEKRGQARRAGERGAGERGTEK